MKNLELAESLLDYFVSLDFSTSDALQDVLEDGEWDEEEIHEVHDYLQQKGIYSDLEDALRNAKNKFMSELSFK